MGVGFILVAEDSREIQKLLEDTILRPAGYEVRSVADGLSALTLARELKPDLLISDNQMPSLSGLELIRRLRKDLPHLPAILMTSEGSEELVVEAMRAGAVDYLTKPFEAEQMLAAVERALERRRGWEGVLQARTKLEGNTRRLERRIQEMETLMQIGRTVTAMLDVDEVLTAVVNAAVRLTEAEEGSLLLLDEETGELYMRASKNFDEEFSRTFRLQVQDSIAGQVVATGQPFLLDQHSPQKIKTSYLVRSLIYVPLQVREHIIGVLGVDNRTVRREFTMEDMTIIRAMADYAAIAIENARLYYRTEEERRKLDTVLSQTENGVILVDAEHRLLFANRASREAFSVPREDVVGLPLDEVFPDPNLQALMDGTGREGGFEEIELGGGRVLSAQRTPIEGVGHAVVMHDITHLKELDRIKSDFVATVSHDLRSPLTAILGYIDLIDRVGELNEQQREFTRRVRVSVEQITHLVTDLLDLGRIEAGLDSTKESTPIAALARHACDNFRSGAEAKGVTLETDLPEGLPMIFGSPIRLRQMVGNLVENAIKYTPPGGKVCIRAEQEGDQVILQVSDTGPGIPAADQPYLFDKFFRASNVLEDHPGTGLGLSIVKSIVDSHGGRIWVQSQLEQGTTFTVVLPTLQS